MLAEEAGRDRDGFGPFSHTDMLLAALVDEARHGNWLLRLINTDKEKRQAVLAHRPEPIHRPGLTRKRNRRASAQAQRILAHMAANRGAAPAGWSDAPAP